MGATVGRRIGGQVASDRGSIPGPLEVIGVPTGRFGREQQARARAQNLRSIGDHVHRARILRARRMIHGGIVLVQTTLVDGSQRVTVICGVGGQVADRRRGPRYIVLRQSPVHPELVLALIRTLVAVTPVHVRCRPCDGQEIITKDLDRGRQEGGRTLAPMGGLRTHLPQDNLFFGRRIPAIDPYRPRHTVVDRHALVVTPLEDVSSRLLLIAFEAGDL